MTKAEIMRAANIVIANLMYCDDDEFVNRLCSVVMNGQEFTQEEIEEEEKNRWINILKQKM